MLIEAQMDRMGNVMLTPKSKKVRKQMRKHNKEWLGHPDDTVFLQEGNPADEFFDLLPPAKRRELWDGWPLTFRMDPWEFGHYVGYDFHEVIRP